MVEKGAQPGSAERRLLKQLSLVDIGLVYVALVERNGVVIGVVVRSCRDVVRVRLRPMTDVMLAVDLQLLFGLMTR